MTTIRPPCRPVTMIMRSACPADGVSSLFTPASYSIDLIDTPVKVQAPLPGESPPVSFRRTVVVLKRSRSSGGRPPGIPFSHRRAGSADIYPGSDRF
jgi:hypothetical protein